MLRNLLHLFLNVYLRGLFNLLSCLLGSSMLNASSRSDWFGMTLLIVVIGLLSIVWICNLLRRLVIEDPLVCLQLHILLRMRPLISQPLLLRLIMVLIISSLIHPILCVHHSHWIHFLVVHRIILLLQILNSRFMVLRFHYFLDASRKWSLNLSFLFWVRSNLLSTHFGR